MTRIRGAVGRVLGHPWTAVALVALCAAVGLTGRDGTTQMLTFILVNVLLAQSINLLSGLAGQVSLGHAGFFAAGAYGSALAVKSWGLPFLLGIPIGAGLAAAIGMLLSFPAGRVREVYLAMMTLGFGLVAFEVIREWDDVTGGTMGISGVPSPGLGTLALGGVRVGTKPYFLLVLTATCAARLAEPSAPSTTASWRRAQSAWTGLRPNAWLSCSAGR